MSLTATLGLCIGSIKNSRAVAEGTWVLNATVELPCHRPRRWPEELLDLGVGEPTHSQTAHASMNGGFPLFTAENI